MRLTIDSTEPLEHVLRVVGSMYGTVLAIAPDSQTTPTKSMRKPPTASKSRRRKAARPSRSRGRVSAAATADVRAWARDSGYQVAGRGRIPDTVLAAFKDAH